MGLSASQARLLTLTSRLADLELKGQNISNSKMRLAAQTEDIARDYTNALDKQKLQVLNGYNGNSPTYADLNYSNLTGLSAYNTLGCQYGLTNNNGKLLVTREMANNYLAASGNLNTFLNAYGAGSITNTETQTPEGYEAATAALTAAQDAYSKFMAEGSLYNVYKIAAAKTTEAKAAMDEIGKQTIKDYEKDIVIVTNNQNSTTRDGSSSDGRTTGTTIRTRGGSSSDGRTTVTTTTTFGGDTRGGRTTGTTTTTSGGDTRGGRTIDTTTTTSGGTSSGGRTSDGILISEDNTSSQRLNATAPKKYEYTADSDVESDSVNTANETSTTTDTTQSTRGGTTSGARTTTDNSTRGGTTSGARTTTDNSTRGGTTPGTRTPDDNSNRGRTTTKAFNYAPGLVTFLESTTAGQKIKYGHAYTNWENCKFAEANALNAFAAIYGSNEPEKVNSTLSKSVTDAQAVLAGVGEPTTKTTIIEGDNSDYYTNLFNRMKTGGYFCQENEENTINNKEWIQAQIQNGNLVLEKSTTKGWERTSVASESNTIDSESDEVGIKKAEAKYNMETDKVKNKDKQYDLAMKQVDTEHSEVQTEIDSVKKVIEKNVERSFKTFNA